MSRGGGTRPGRVALREYSTRRAVARTAPASDKQARAGRGDTYIGFIDFKSAYDMVPHDLLVKRLASEVGLPDNSRLVTFVRSLYASSFFRVRVQGELSERQRLLRGVR